MQTSAQQIGDLLGQHRFRYDGEKDLQEGIARVLRDAGIPFQREVKLDDAGVIDFVVQGGIGIEVKVRGSLTAMTIQVHRYMRQDRIRSLLIVTTSARLRQVPQEMNGKPVVVCWLARGAF